MPARDPSPRALGSGTAGFYADLPAFGDFLEVTELRHYREVPDDWRIVITDVRDSTKAIEAGRYKDVNSLGVASIVALRNALPDLELPFLFGGDGATLLVPEECRTIVETTLRGLRTMARVAFDMQMRGATIAVRELRAAGHPLLVARYQASPDVFLAMFRGSALAEAERRVKDPEHGRDYAVGDDGPSSADFRGFECRWQAIPSRHGHVASILVQARRGEGRSADSIYRELLRRIEGILEGDGRPVASTTLRLQGRDGDFDTEAKIRAGAGAGWRLAWGRWRARTFAMIGAALMRRGWTLGGFPGSTYKNQVVANTDFRKFDDTLRMVVDVDATGLEEIRALLAAGHATGELVFGLHVSDASLMTCAIQAYAGHHVHFIDGADGGYALAAKQLKRQMKST